MSKKRTSRKIKKPKGFVLSIVTVVAKQSKQRSFFAKPSPIKLVLKKKKGGKK